MNDKAPDQHPENNSVVAKPATDKPPKVVPIKNESASLFAAAKKIHPRSIKGFFTSWRWVFVWLTQIVFYGLPWVQWAHRQAVWFDLGTRRFFVFGLVIYPQDLIYLTGILVISALSLFLFTAVAGRLWCGYACPQTVYTEIFMWVEKKMEGDRGARLRLDKSPWNVEKIWRRGGKLLIWVLISLWTGLTFVGYFSPIRELVHSFAAWNIGGWETFWIFFYGAFTLVFAGFMREQVCKYMCPYARFQSAMFDPDTMIVTYDEKRGEPRAPNSKKVANRAEAGLGDCIDCSMCVQVCPTGIDIRNGLQYECIGCGACVDACDQMMDKTGMPRGLVKYSTENAMKNGWTRQQTVRRIFRPRVLVYSTILTLIGIAVVISLTLRSPMKVDIIRDRGVMSRYVEDANVENVYLIRVMNTRESQQHYTVTVEGLPDAVIAQGADVTVNSAQVYESPLSVRVPAASLKPGSHNTIYFVIKEDESGATIREKATFFAPK